MTQLLRSVLARNAKEAAVSIGPLAPAKDTAKLKKHLSLVSAWGHTGDIQRGWSAGMVLLDLNISSGHAQWCMQLLLLYSLSLSHCVADCTGHRYWSALPEVRGWPWRVMTWVTLPPPLLPQQLGLAWWVGGSSLQRER
jgi:hypothetical protein